MANRVQMPMRPFAVEVGPLPGGHSCVNFVIRDPDGGNDRVWPMGSYILRDHAQDVAQIVADGAYRQFDRTGATPSYETIWNLFVSAHQVLLDRLQFDQVIDEYLALRQFVAARRRFVYGLGY